MKISRQAIDYPCMNVINSKLIPYSFLICNVLRENGYSGALVIDVEDTDVIALSAFVLNEF